MSTKRKLWTIRNRKGEVIQSSEGRSPKPVMDYATHLRSGGFKVNVWVTDDDGLRLYREWRRGKWRDPSKRLRPLRKPGGALNALVALGIVSAARAAGLAL